MEELLGTPWFENAWRVGRSKTPFVTSLSKCQSWNNRRRPRVITQTGEFLAMHDALAQSMWPNWGNKDWWCQVSHIYIYKGIFILYTIILFVYRGIHIRSFTSFLNWFYFSTSFKTVAIYIYMYIYVYIYMYGWTEGCMDVWMDVCMYACMYVCMYVYVYVHVYVYVYVYV